MPINNLPESVVSLSESSTLTASELSSPLIELISSTEDDQIKLITIPHHLPFHRDQKVEPDRDVAVLVFDLSEEENLELQAELSIECAKHGYKHRSDITPGTPGKHGPKSVYTSDGERLGSRGRLTSTSRIYAKNASPAKAVIKEAKPNSIPGLRTPPASARKTIKMKITKSSSEKVNKERQVLGKKRRLRGQNVVMTKPGGPAKGISAREIAKNAAGTAADGAKWEHFHLCPLQHMLAEEAQQPSNLVVATYGANSKAENIENIGSALAKKSPLVESETDAELFQGTHIASKITKVINDPSRNFSEEYTINGTKDRKPLRVESVYLEVITNNKIRRCAAERKRKSSTKEETLESTIQSVIISKENALLANKDHTNAAANNLTRICNSAIRKRLFTNEPIAEANDHLSIGAVIEEAGSNGDITSMRTAASPVYGAFFQAGENNNAKEELANTDPLNSLEQI